MKTFSPTIFYTSLRGDSSGYNYDTIQIRELGLYKLTASIGIEFNNDNFDSNAIGSVYIYNPNAPRPVIALNMTTSTGSQGDVKSISPVASCEFVIEPGTYEIHYGFRKTSAVYQCQMSLILEKLL